MTKVKLLKQLQKVQANIRQCDEKIKQLRPPKPDEYCVEFNAYYLLRAIIYGEEKYIKDYQSIKYAKYDDATYEYLRQIGGY